MSHLRQSSSPGKVFLIGAGVGDADLITVRGLRYVMQADVILYDRLIDPRLLDHAAPTARLVDVGKRPGQSASQAWIQRLMVAEARQGLQVVRLKSGDPFIFGRGGEEVEALIEAGIPYEIVPGVSSALGVPALAGLPVLHRDYSSSVSIVSGHTFTPALLNTWAALLQQSSTLVILMGMANLAGIACGLQQAGIAPTMPVAVSRTGLPEGSCTVLSTLADIAEAACEVGAPAVIIIGNVVAWKQRWERGEPAAELAWMAREFA